MISSNDQRSWFLSKTKFNTKCRYNVTFFKMSDRGDETVKIEKGFDMFLHTGQSWNFVEHFYEMQL